MPINQEKVSQLLAARRYIIILKRGKQLVYDTDGNYFRIEDTTLTGKRVYTDINGNQIPNNKFVN